MPFRRFLSIVILATVILVVMIGLISSGDALVIGGTLAGALVATLTSWLFLSRVFTKQTQALRELTDRIGEGRARLALPSQDPVNTLSEAITTMEEAVADRERRLRHALLETQMILEAIRDGMVVVSNDRRILAVNAAAQRFLGLAHSSIGQRIPETSPPEPPWAALTRIMKAVETNEMSVALADPMEVTLAPSRIPLADGEGTMMGAIYLMRDITREREFDRLKSEFISLAAHQLRTPLTAVKWILSQLASTEMKSTESQRDTMIKEASLSAERMVRLVNNLLNISRIEQGRALATPEPIALEALIDKLAGNFANVIQEKRFNLQVEKPLSPLRAITVDPEAIGIAIENVLTNAIAYTPAGGTITVAIREDEAKSGIEVIIHDTGVGIPESMREKMFTKFARGDNVVLLQTEGSGLGLYITKTIIERHGGTITFESKENEGTTFTIRLPYTT
ncbi:MAG: PAS domain-containing protein [Parcubacteria group bacterium]|nr:PAS domain-containing protein [Parcubacteria group bacterium]